MMSSVTAFVWQAALMLLGAYFLGTFIGCWLRRRFNAPPKVAMESRADTKIAGTAAATAAAPPSERFGRALDGGDPAARPPSSEPTVATAQVPEPQASLAVSPSAPDPNAEPSGAMGDAAARTVSSEAVVAEPVPIAPVAPPPLPIPPEAPPVPVAPAPEQPKQFSPPMSAAAAAAAALAARQAAAPHKTEASAPPAPADPAPDLAKPLAEPPAAAPTTVAGELEPLVPPTPAVAPDLPASSGSAGQATVKAQIEQAVAMAPAEPDDLTKIEGVTDNDATALRDAGVTTFSAIAGWTADDVARANGSIAGERRIARENWIEQAQLLQNGGSTSYSRRILANLAPRPGTAPVLASVSSGNGPTEAPAARSIDIVEAEPAPSPPAIPSVKAASDPAPAPSAAPAATLAAGAPANPNPDVSQRAAFAREHRGYADDLQQIDGINSEVEKLVNEQGVTRVAQIAGWSAAEQQRIDQLLGSMNRVRRENWVGQARRISGFSEAVPEAEVSTKTDAPVDDAAGGQSEPESNVLPLSSVPAIARNNVRGFRSVRSEALVGANTVDSNSSGDDLKRIRSIGVLIEKRLSAMGYTSYEQIGSWTQSDVDRVNQKLDFRGRIERENWIEQARILAAGGQTEFSRRQERSED